MSHTDSGATIAAVRAFNRFYTQAVGVLAEQHLGTGLTLGQARVLFEIGRGTTELSALRRALGVDAGYLSRVLSELEATGLVARRASRADRRAREVSPTAKGKSKLRKLDERSDRAAAGLIEHLDARSRARLVAAMHEIERLLDDVRIEAEPVTGSDARACLRAYYDELAERFEGGFDPAASVSAHDDEVTPPRGVFVVLRREGQALGCGALKTLSPGVGEIKRMWIHGSLRGRGLGSRMLDALEAHAVELGMHTVRLDTRADLREALGLYQRCGYVEIPRYNDNPYATHWLEKRLAE